MDSHADIKKQYLIAAILALVGMVFLAVSLAIGDLWNGAFFGELVDIAAWVFVWEAVDVICFRKQELRVNRTRYQALMNMEIDLKKTGCADEEKVLG